MADEAPRRLSISAAATALGVSRDTVRRRIARGELQAQRDNLGHWQVELPQAAQAAMPGADAPARAAHAHTDADAALAEVRAHVQSLRDDVADLRVERDRLLALVERITAERTPPPRRSWPGARTWWRRFWTGEG